uniref:hypothetical protein n=1 Tax=Faecalicatena contorta TaxID=39482 RepID=UPI00359C1C9D
ELRYPSKRIYGTALPEQQFRIARNTHHWDISPDWLEPTSGLGGSNQRNIQIVKNKKLKIKVSYLFYEVLVLNP